MKDLLINTIITAMQRSLKQGCTDINIGFRGSRGYGMGFKINFIASAQRWNIHVGDTYRPTFTFSTHTNPMRALVIVRQLLRAWNYGWNERDYPIDFAFPDNYQFEIAHENTLPSFLHDYSYTHRATKEHMAANMYSMFTAN